MSTVEAQRERGLPRRCPPRDRDRRYLGVLREMAILRQLTIRSLARGPQLPGEGKRLRRNRPVEYLFAVYDQLHCAR